MVDNFVEKNINGVPLEGLGAEHAGKLRLCFYYDSRNTNFKANENVFFKDFCPFVSDFFKKRFHLKQFRI